MVTVNITEDQVSICGELKGGILSNRAIPVGGPNYLLFVQRQITANGDCEEELVAWGQRRDTEEPCGDVRYNVHGILTLYYGEDVALSVLRIVEENSVVGPSC